MKITVKEVLACGWHSCFPFSDERIVYERVTADSRKTAQGCLFFAFDGIKSPGKNYIPDAIANRAAAVFVDEKYETGLTELEKSCEIPFFYCADFTSRAAATISMLYQNPSAKMRCIGVTGTNGKTTIAWAIYSVLKDLGRKPSYVGTIGIELPDESVAASLTTPPIDEMHRLLHAAYLQNGDFFVAEASSHGLSQGRLAAINWNIAVFTNLTEDHRDYHKTMDDYYSAKKILFECWAKTFQDNIHRRENTSPKGAAVINTDDKYGERLFDWLKTTYSNLPVISVGKNGMAKIVSISPSWNGYHAMIEFSGRTYNLRSRCIGAFNIYNLTTAFIALLQLGFTSGEILTRLESFTGAPGRMEMHRKPNASMVVVDYAHTPDALKKSLETLRELQPEKIVVIFGCGGDRDRDKRSQMGKIADEYADFTIITNDNPRTENPKKIIDEIKSGIVGKDFKVIFDRRQAIEEAVAKLNTGQVLLIAGKGHEDYQILPEGKIKFSDGEVVREAICKI